MACDGEWLSEQLKGLTVKFEEADKDKNGSLTMQEVFDILQAAGYKGTQTDLNRIFFDMDQNKDSKVTKDEFVKCFDKLPKPNRREMVLWAAFKKMDKDGSGTLSKTELMDQAVFKNVGMSDEEISNLKDFVSEDSDGQVKRQYKTRTDVC
ncbi:calmodulin-like protein [Elysia marginata]|uniref:Calmodulin-like protein n=1 Tax=Elysia marginata TaxID=1093978 RepID=A0AAV4F7C1_9GAST|nr:calmodulin-like protein [Elysia marginata]